MMDQISVIAWMLKNNIKTENGSKYDFHSHAFWFDVLTDLSPKQVWFKCAQVGGSLVANLKLFWLVKHMGMNAIYTLPTAHDVKEFVGGKVNTLIANNPVLQQYVQDKDTIEQKRVGDRMIYFRGTWVERAALSVSSDINIYDEVDRSKQSVIEQYHSRLQHSKFGWEWFFSNPSVEGNGVSKFWSKSDQKHWFITCSRCQKKQYLSWPDSINIEQACFVCKKCHQPLREEDRRVGSWHKKVTSANPEYSGYWVSLLMAPWVSAEKIIDLYKTKSPDYFANFVLGLPYIGKGNKLREDEFFSNLTSDVNTRSSPIVIGVDTGLPIWYVVGNREGLFHWGKCDDYGEIERLLKRFPKSIVVMDQGGDLIGPRKLQEEHPGRIFLCYYRRDRKRVSMIDWGKGVESGKVIADRNKLIQSVVDEIRDRRIPIFGNQTDWWEPWTHFANIFRTVKEDTLGQETIVWERNGADHLVHAICYWRTGMEKFGFREDNFISSSLELTDFAKPTVTVSYDQTIPAISTGYAPKSRDWRDI